MPRWTCGWTLVATCCAAGLAARAAEIPQTVDGIVQAYLQTIQPQRFEQAHQMSYRREFSWPTAELRPAAYVTWIEFNHWVKPPQRRCDGKIGPIMPGGGEPEVHSHVWSGKSEANLYALPRNNSLTISRRAPSSNVPMANLILSALGVAQLPDEQEEASQQRYWLPDGVSEAAGYQLLAEPETINGAACRVIRKGNEDSLWFDCSGPVKLLRRDTWRRVPDLHREVIELADYDAAGLPKKIVIDRYAPTNQVGTPTKIAERETLLLKEVTFAAPPDSAFVLNIPPDTSVLDINTLMEFQVQRPGSAPFAAVLSQPRGDQARTSPLVWASLFGGGVMALLAGLWLRRRTVD